MHDRRDSAVFALCVALGSLSTTVEAADYARSTFGTLADGQSVEAITLTNTHGIAVRIIALGASVQMLTVPDRAGKTADIVLGYANLGDYLTKPAIFRSHRRAIRKQNCQGTFRARRQDLPTGDE